MLKTPIRGFQFFIGENKRFKNSPYDNVTAKQAWRTSFAYRHRILLIANNFKLLLAKMTRLDNAPNFRVQVSEKIVSYKWSKFWIIQETEEDHNKAHVNAYHSLIDLWKHTTVKRGIHVNVIRTETTMIE